jgi:hypothetical protein
VSGLTNLSDNQIGDHTGEQIVFLVFLSLLPLLLGFYFLSHWEILHDPLTIKLHWKNLLLFIFSFFPLIIAPCFDVQCDDLGSQHSSLKIQCDAISLWSFVTCDDQGSSHCVSLQPATIVKKIDFLWFFLPRY